MKQYSFSLLLFCCLFFSLLTTQTHAQIYSGVKLIPASIEESANPGDVLQRSLSVTNESDEEKEYYFYKRNIKGVEGGGVPIFAKDEGERTGFEMTEWIEIPSDPVKIPPKASVEIPLIVRVPDTATPGSHFAGVFVSLEPPKLRQTGAGVGYEVTSIISIRISGSVIDTARIRSFSTDKLFYTSKNVKFNVKIENQGNILIRPQGPLTITGMFSTKPETVAVNPNLAGVFPGTMREYDNIEWNSEGLGFGRYEAVLALVYDGDGGSKTIDSSLVFWVFPIKVIAIVVGAFVGIVGLGYLFTRYYVQQAVMRAAGGRRIIPQRYRRQIGISRFAFIFTAVLAALVLFLLVLLVLLA